MIRCSSDFLLQLKKGKWNKNNTLPEVSHFLCSHYLCTIQLFYNEAFSCLVMSTKMSFSLTFYVVNILEDFYLLAATSSYYEMSPNGFSLKRQMVWQKVYSIFFRSASSARAKIEWATDQFVKVYNMRQTIFDIWT